MFEITRHRGICLEVSFSDVIQFSSRWYLCARKSPYALPPHLSDTVRNNFNVRLIDDGPLSSFQGRSSSASSFNACLLQAIDGVMPLALCPQVVSQAPKHKLSSSETQATYDGCFARQSPVCSVMSVPFTVRHVLRVQIRTLWHTHE